MNKGRIKYGNVYQLFVIKTTIICKEIIVFFFIKVLVIKITYNLLYNIRGCCFCCCRGYLLSSKHFYTFFSNPSWMISCMFWMVYLHFWTIIKVSSVLWKYIYVYKEYQRLTKKESEFHIFLKEIQSKKSFTYFTFIFKKWKFKEMRI